MKVVVVLIVLTACSKTPPPPKQPPIVTITHSIVKDVPLYYEYVGHIEANIAVNVKPQVTGIITNQYFVEGDDVKTGDLLVTIDPRPYQAALDKAEGQLARNLATLKQAKDKAERYARLVQQEYVSQLDFDQYVTDVMTAEASVQQSRADVETAKLNLEYCYIHAPVDAVASVMQVDVGNYVGIGGDSPLLVLNQVAPIKVSFYVPEKDLPRITCLHREQALKTIVFLQDMPVEGTLSLINNGVDEKTGTILLQALFPNIDKKLWPGEFVDVRLILEIAKSAVLVPTQAVQIGQEGHYIFVMKNDHTVEQRSIVTGQKEEEMTIIEKGLSPGETVILDGQINLYPGVQVAIKS